MEREKNKLLLIDVVHVSKKLVESVVGDDCTRIIVPIELIDENGNLVKYESYSICKKNEVLKANTLIRRLNGSTKKDFINNNPYCHIITLPANIKYPDYVSFDKNDDYPYKVEFSKKYNYVESFFNRYNSMRNQQIDNGEILKDGDIYEFLEYISESNNNYDSAFKRLIKRFINS